MAKKYSNLGLNNGVPPSTLTDEEALALFHKNGRNHPVTRLSHAEKVLLARDGQARKTSGSKKTG